MSLSSGAKVLFKLTGDKELRAKLKNLERKMQQRIAKTALTKAMRIIAKAEKAAAPFPLVKDSIGSSVKTARKTGVVTAKAGVNVGKRPMGRMSKRTGKIVKGSQQQPIAHMLVLGTVNRYTGSTTRAKGRRGRRTSTGNARAYRGRLVAHKFLKPAAKAAWASAKQVAAASARQDIAAVASVG